MPTADQITLLSLCSIKGVSWYLIAREAMHPEGLARLSEGDTVERSEEATKARRSLRAALERLDDLRERMDQSLQSLMKPGVQLTTVLDATYPLNLRTIFNCPPFLFYRGELREDDTRAVAVVGTRQPTATGVRRAKKMAGLLSEEKVTVLSGLARGIDTAAHEAALEAGGRTVAVLGSGLNRVYPKENEPLAERICSSGGAVVSQFWLDSPPAQFTFPRRNITMSGLGQGTVVIEASATSGAKMQARLALQHGKKVFLLESLVKDHTWARTYVQRPGAKMVKDVEDILEELRSSDEIRSATQQTSQLSLSLS